MTTVSKFALLGGVALLALPGCKQETNYPPTEVATESTTTVIPVPGPTTTEVVPVPGPTKTVVVPVPGPTHTVIETQAPPEEVPPQ